MANAKTVELLRRLEAIANEGAPGDCQNEYAFRFGRLRSAVEWMLSEQGERPRRPESSAA